MSWTEAGILAGSVSTVLFVAGYLPMLHKAVRSRDLASYSLGNLVIANVGNGVHTVYVLSLPPGPLWALHAFYLGSSALMLLWWWRFRTGTSLSRSARQSAPKLRDKLLEHIGQAEGRGEIDRAGQYAAGID